MVETLLDILRCPVTKSKLTIDVIKLVKKDLGGIETSIIQEAVLYAEKDWFYPVIDGIPRLIVEAVCDYEDFFIKNVHDFDTLKNTLFSKNGLLINAVVKKNKRTKESFAKEWSIFDITKDKTWDAGEAEMLDRFLNETGETLATLSDKLILDAGCGNGLLNLLLAKNGVGNIAMDFSDCIVKVNEANIYSNLHFIQGDIQYPPFADNYFDLVQCSGVLIHTNNTKFSFSCITKLVKQNGKLSVWLYHTRDNFIHNMINRIRNVTSKLPLKFQYYLYRVTIFPACYLVKKIKGNRQNSREMMIDILDWFTPQFRWEHTTDEVTTWFLKDNFSNIKVTTTSAFGFNMIGVKETVTESIP
jgi:2-polyprenyl-3-methyl-5-hydroxy-6-metoxy-1,4-benzoquinol methylase/uncharacterized protein YbaR (Trm112 family)